MTSKNNLMKSKSKKKNITKKSLFKLKLEKNEHIYINLITSIFILIVLIATNSLTWGQMGKVDFLSSFGSQELFSGWSKDNFGYSTGLSAGLLTYQGIVDLFPQFIFKDFLFYYAAPIYLAFRGIYIFTSNLFKNNQQLNSRLIGSYTVAFFFLSSSFASVFIYGWNLLLLLPIAGMTFSCYGIDKFYETQDKTFLLVIALGSFLIGGMVQFLIVPLLWTISRNQKVSQILKGVVFLILGDAYTIVPQVYATAVGGENYYKGVDPIMQTREIQESTGILSRVSGVFDPMVMQYWTYLPWILLFLVALIGIFLHRNQGYATFGGRVAITIFAILNFSGLVWNVSLNKYWAELPFIGGIFRNPDKIFFIFSIFLFAFASVWLSAKRMIGWTLLAGLIFTSSSFYLSDETQKITQVAQVNFPDSYVDILEKLGNAEPGERVLLLPIPEWFHRYSWTKEIQTTNIIRQAISSSIISEEMTPIQNIPKRLSEHLNLVSSNSCKVSVSAANDLGLTKIIVQFDLPRERNEAMAVYLKLINCFGKPILKSKEFAVFEVYESPGMINFENASFKSSSEAIENNLLGYKVCLKDDSVQNLRLFESSPENAHFMLERMNIISVTYINSLGFKSWQLVGPKCYSLVNANAFVGLTSSLVSITTILVLTIFLAIRLLKGLALRRKSDEKS
jgi:hypothetical protein